MKQKKEKHKLFRFVIVGPLLLLLLSLEGDEVKYWMDGVNWVGLGWGRGQIIIPKMCVCVLYLTYKSYLRSLFKSQTTGTYLPSLRILPRLLI